MKLKPSRILLTYLVPFLFLTTIGCMGILVPTEENLSAYKVDAPLAEEISEHPGLTRQDSSRTLTQRGKNSGPAKQMANLPPLSSQEYGRQVMSPDGSGLQVVSPDGSDLQATALAPENQSGVSDPQGDPNKPEQLDTSVTRVQNELERQQENLDASLQLCQEAQKQWQDGNPDSALDILDSAYELLIAVNPDNDAALLQQKDDLRFLISKRTIEIYASRQNIVNGTHREIPLSMNEHVKKEIDYFVGPEREGFLKAWKRSGLYRPMIVKELKEAGLPERLCWLPLIESYFKERALSRARALGLWQFIPSTGYKFGLKRDTWIDERMDPKKSTLSAIEYLRQLHNIFGDWATVLAAYNCGEGKVLRVIRQQRINYLDNFWDLYELLPRETARYVPRFLAAVHIIEDPNQFGIELGQPLSPLEYEEVAVNKQISLKSLAHKLGKEEDILNNLNYELRYHTTPNYEYRLKVPPNTGEQVLACLDSIPEWTPPESTNGYITVRLRKGETLSHLANRYRTSVASITRANRIGSTKRLQIGQKIRVPLNRKNQAKASFSKTKGGTSSRYRVYYVKKGDCSFNIAHSHDQDLTEFLKVNGLTQDSILQPGQRLLVKSN